MEIGRRDRRGHACALLLFVAVLASLSVHLVAADSPSESADSKNGLAWTSGFPNWLNSFSNSVSSGMNGDANWPVLEVNPRVIAAAILSSVGACICAAGGVGGGGLYIPIFNLLLLFSAKTSAALSNIMILGGSLAVLAWNLRQAHPFSPEKPLIDYDVALLLNPNMLLGISIGVFCNIMFPGWLLISVLTVILFYMTNRSVKSGFSRWRKESNAAKAVKAKLASGDAEAVENGSTSNSSIQPMLCTD